MEFIIRRGAREVGGSCVEVRAGGTRLVLDAGLPLVDGNRDPFDSLAALRAGREELVTRRVAPPVPGLFDDGPPPPDAILLSHAHLDHSGLLHHSRPNVPIYATVGTSKMMNAAGVFANRPPLDRARHRAITPGGPFQVGAFTVTPFAVDHSTYGCVAFLLEAGGKSLLYSGDLRVHGRKPGMVRAMIEAVAPRGVDVLLMEGTHFGSDREQGMTEYQLEERVTELARSAPGLVLAAFSPLDVDRLVTVYKAARSSGRVFVADAYAAYVLHLIASEVRVPRATRAAGIRVFYNAGFRRKKIAKLEDHFSADRIELEEVLTSPTRHLMAFRPSMVGPDFGGHLPSHCRLLYGFWAGYLKNPDWAELQQRVAESGGDFIPAHTSGHIYVDDLVRVVRALNARAVVPIHTFEPERFRDHFPHAVLVPDGRPYQIN